jgi:hypothetical protein
MRKEDPDRDLGFLYITTSFWYLNFYNNKIDSELYFSGLGKIGQLLDDSRRLVTY